METINDILREMRDLGRLDEKSTDKIPRSSQGLGLRIYTNRIEAAHKRELAEAIVAKCEVCDQVAVAKSATTTANDCRKAREVLTRVHEFLSNLCRDGRCDTHCSECIGASDLADDVYDVLHTPPRNCERFKTKEEAALAYAEECKAFIPQSILWQIGEWLDWLFAEAKGDAK